MALQCPIGLDVDHLRQEIQKMYSEVASAPEGDFHFHRGPAFAAERLGYDAVELDALPSSATESFAGVGNPLAIGELAPGETVVDLGSGAGTDLLLAALRVGPEGRAIGIDMTDAMLASARASAEKIGASQVELRKGDLLELPIDDDSVDVVISNGVLNLAPDKTVAFSEIARILKPGGRLLLADIVMSTELDESSRGDIELWAGWIAGALQSAELAALLSDLGFIDIAEVGRFDTFAGTSKEKTARSFGVEGANFFARLPDAAAV